ncbi:hypothetical protein [Streptomyces sp. NBC_00378]|uniref:aromatic-ring hydroxylase C-terminal domain-containing protein n=1 Tax=unclassified Streptomyces TaxID=2593676 RepID=UPI00338E23CB
MNTRCPSPGWNFTLRSVRTAAQREAEPGQWARLIASNHEDAALLVRPDGHIAWRGTCRSDLSTLPALTWRVLAAS